jgi:hypothetical protein
VSDLSHKKLMLLSFFSSSSNFFCCMIVAVNRFTLGFFCVVVEGVCGSNANCLNIMDSAIMAASCACFQLTFEEGCL